jgi:hypothetical protein
MPYLHWATTGEALDLRYSVIKELAEKFRDPSYRRPTPEEIDGGREQSAELKLIRAFLQPKNDKCLHIRRTLDQYYYSTLPDADERTIDQVVYKYAKKQHNLKLEEARKEQEENERRQSERSASSLLSIGSRMNAEVEPIATDVQEQELVEASWDPPRVMMVNQLWMWIIDGGEYEKRLHPWDCANISLVDTVITSFPAKSKSELSVDDRANTKDYMEGDDIYDSTDIWRAVQRELRNRTPYGQRTAKSALDLAWTIADQARGVFQRRDLHPHLQFIQMFEMEINEIVRC